MSATQALTKTSEKTTADANLSVALDEMTTAEANLSIALEKKATAKANMSDALEELSNAEKNLEFALDEKTTADAKVDVTMNAMAIAVINLSIVQEKYNDLQRRIECQATASTVLPDPTAPATTTPSVLADTKVVCMCCMWPWSECTHVPTLTLVSNTTKRDKCPNPLINHMLEKSADYPYRRYAGHFCEQCAYWMKGTNVTRKDGLHPLIPYKK